MYLWKTLCDRLASYISITAPAQNKRTRQVENVHVYHQSFIFFFPLKCKAALLSGAAHVPAVNVLHIRRSGFNPQTPCTKLQLLFFIYLYCFCYRLHSERVRRSCINLPVAAWPDNSIDRFGSFACS